MTMSVVVLVMDVRVVRMRVTHRPMEMPMRVRLDSIPIRAMTVPVMLIMQMGMRMLEELVLMSVFMHFGQV